MSKKIANAKFFTVVLCALVFLPVFAPKEGMGQAKLKPEEIVNKHLESIGSAEARAPGRSRIVSGNSVVTLRTGGSGQAAGPASIASKDDTVWINANFEAPDYPFERISYDGKKLVVRQYKPGARSPIGEFFLTFDEVFEEGLAGGTLSAAWALLHLEERRAKLKYDGTDKVDGRAVYRLKYQPRKSSDLKIKLYFDAENFRHVRTEYERTIAAQMGAAPGTSVSQRETHFKVTEDFSDFTTVGGLTLPKKYKIGYSYSSRNNPIEIDWGFDFSRYEFNQPINIEDFRDEN